MPIRSPAADGDVEQLWYSSPRRRQQLQRTNHGHCWGPTLEADTQTLVLSAGGGGADIQGGEIIFDYTGDPDPASTIQSLLTTSYGASPHFAAGKIKDSTAAATGVALGWADDTTHSRVTVMATYYGDANLDGTVNSEDMAILWTPWNWTTMTWSQGDFNYSGTVDKWDSLLLGNDFHFGMPSAPSLLWSPPSNSPDPTVWDLTTPNWFDGNNRVCWANGDMAVFDGPGGATVDVSGTVTASTIEFDASGYVIQDGGSGCLSLLEGGTIIRVEDSGTATIDCPLHSPTSGSSDLLKYGTGRLILDGQNTYTGGTIVYRARSRSAVAAQRETSARAALMPS